MKIDITPAEIHALYFLFVVEPQRALTKEVEAGQVDATSLAGEREEFTDTIRSLETKLAKAGLLEQCGPCLRGEGRFPLRCLRCNTPGDSPCPSSCPCRIQRIKSDPSFVDPEPTPLRNVVAAPSFPGPNGIAPGRTVLVVKPAHSQRVKKDSNGELVSWVVDMDEFTETGSRWTVGREEDGLFTLREDPNDEPLWFHPDWLVGAAISPPDGAHASTGEEA